MATKLGGLTANSIEVLNARYLKKDDEGNVIEEPKDMFRRVAHFLAEAEHNYFNEPEGRITTVMKAISERVEEEFYTVMTNLELLPNSPTLMNAGRDLGQLSGCFVLPIEDSIAGIFEAVKQTAIIHKSGGGTGFSFSSLRPAGSRVRTTSGIASGPVSFMDAFDVATHVVKQGGTRRGANMGVLHYTHPDIESFIIKKLEGTSLQNFNISVTVDDEFMRAVKEDWSYDLINPITKEVTGELKAKEVFNLIVECAHKTGDPGLIFIDRVNKDNWNPQLGPIESTNPCGEQPLLPYESCNLGSINLSKFVQEGQQDLDWDHLKEVCIIAVRMMDNVIDMNTYPLPEIAEMTRNTRRIGLGVMGFADMLIKLGIRYDSNAGLEWGSKVMRFVREEVWEASRNLASERGSYPEAYNSVMGDHKDFRNTSPTTIAPTGTISIIAGCSSGIEPLFALAYTRNVLDGANLVEMNELLQEAQLGNLFWEKDFLLEGAMLRLLSKEGSFSNTAFKDYIPDSVREVFRTSHEISPEWHIRMQAKVQEETDNAVSKTINMPNDATIEDVAKAYLFAHETGCKGVTIYRDGSKPTQVLNLGTQAISPTTPQILPSMNGTGELRSRETRVGHPYIERPKTLHGITPKISTGHGTLYPTINMDEEGKIREVFINLGKVGDCTNAFTEGLARLLSTALSCGVDAEVLANQLVGLSCKHTSFDNGDLILSVPDAVGKAMLMVLGVDYKVTNNLKPSGNLCPDCGGMLKHEEGCVKCSNPRCPYSECN